MKKIIIVSAVLLLITAISMEVQAQKSEKKKKKNQKEQVVAVPAFANNRDTVSYIIGADIAKKFEENSLDLNKDMLFRGFSDFQVKADTIFTEDQIAQIMTAWQQGMSAKKMAQAEANAEKNIKAGDEFLAANKLKEGVIETESGLQYKILKPGEGDSPDDNDMVEVHYTGTLIDGTVFDSSRERGEPIEFPVNGVIPGWTEALKLMKKGSQFMLYIPARLGYGNQKTGPIPEGSTLIFDVELLEFEKK